jgi:hypothetical protein
VKEFGSAPSRPHKSVVSIYVKPDLAGMSIKYLLWNPHPWVALIRLLYHLKKVFVVECCVGVITLSHARVQHLGNEGLRVYDSS